MDVQLAGPFGTSNQIRERDRAWEDSGLSGPDDLLQGSGSAEVDGRRRRAEGATNYRTQISELPPFVPISFPGQSEPPDLAAEINTGRSVFQARTHSLRFERVSAW